MSVKYDKRRGRHKKAASRETEVWNREHLIPDRPAWMPAEVYVKLAQMRAEP